MTGFSLTDVHCHLQDDRFDGDLAQVIARAELVGVSKFVCNASAPSDWEKTLQIARKHRNVLPCFGLHPLYVSESAGTDWLDQLAELLENASRELSQLVGVGEIGIDRYIVPRDDHLQEDVFRKQLRLAARFGMPVMLHTRHSVDRVVEMLQSHFAEKPTFSSEISAFLVHGFSGSTERVGQIVKMGGYFSFSANILKIHHKKTRHAAAVVPLDRVLLESDAPDMPPPANMVPSNWSNLENKVKRGKYTESGISVPVRNEPAILPAVLAELAKLRNMPTGELAAMIAENEAAFFKKA